MAELKKWKAASNYAGDEYPDYYVVYGRSRDSTLLDQANFESALKRLGGESKTVITPRASHWAVGWVEPLLVHKDDAKAVEEAQAIVDALADYPVLDEELYSRKEYDASIENIKAGGYRYHLTDNEAGKVYNWLSDRGDPIENTDDTGFFPDDKQLEDAVAAIRRRKSLVARAKTIQTGKRRREKTAPVLGGVR